MHLRAKRRSRLLVVKIREKRVVFAIQNAPRVQSLGQDARQR